MQLLSLNYYTSERQQKTKTNFFKLHNKPRNKKYVPKAFTRLTEYRETQLTLKLTGTRPIKGDNEKLKYLSQYLLAKLLQLSTICTATFLLLFCYCVSKI